MRNKITIGTRVAYSAAFLRSTGLYVGRYGFLRGNVIAFDKYAGCTVAIVQWDGEKVHGRVNIKNLARVGGAAMSTN